jgi:hypothetical protein
MEPRILYEPEERIDITAVRMCPPYEGGSPKGRDTQSHLVAKLHIVLILLADNQSQSRKTNLEYEEMEGLENIQIILDYLELQKMMSHPFPLRFPHESISNYAQTYTGKGLKSRLPLPKASQLVPTMSVSLSVPWLAH